MNANLATIEWPETLPLPLLDYTGRPLYNTLTSERSLALAARRSRFKRPYNVLSVKWILSPSQWIDFQTFFNITLGAGAAPFVILLRFPENIANQYWIVGFVGDGYEAQQIDGRWEVEAEINLMYELEIEDPAEPLLS